MKRERCKEVQIAAGRIELLTGCKVIHASKHNGSCRPYFSVVLKAQKEWAEDFVETRGEENGQTYPSPASDWLKQCGLPRTWLSVKFGHTYGENYTTVYLRDTLCFDLYWSDLYKMGWQIPEIRTNREIKKGLTLAQVY